MKSDGLFLVSPARRLSPPPRSSWLDLLTDFTLGFLPILAVGFLWLIFDQTPLSSAPSSVEPLFARIPEMKLKVVRVIDPDFTDITEEDVNTMLKSARKIYSDKFGVDNVRFVNAGHIPIDQFFASWLKKESDAFRQKDARRFRVGQKNDFEIHKPTIMAFIQNWKLEELQGFFPENERAKYDSYEKVYEGIVTQMQAKIAQIAEIQVGGKSLLKPESMEWRSFLNWLLVLETQTEYDVVLTNTFILYDDISQPAPHSIFTKCKVGGVSHKNPLRKELGQRVIMSSTFGMDTDIPMFAEYGDNGRVTRNQRDEVTGGYVIAHELGHAIFKLPDHYNHGPECLMNNAKNQTYKQGFDLLVAHPGPCLLCHPWMKARSQFFDAEWNYDHGFWETAINFYLTVMKETPKNVDGSYPGYIAYLCYKMSNAFYKVGNKEMARKGAKKAVELYKWEPLYQEWLQKLEAEAP